MSRLSDYLHDRDRRPVPVLYAFSRHVVPAPADYTESAHITGYWFRPDGDAQMTDPGLTASLEREQPVVYIGFGSMGFGKDADRRGEIVGEAVQKADVSAVVATGWGGLSLESGDRIHVIEHAPHSWLFPRVAAVVHHGGAGTTAAGLRAARPTLVCPFLGDQPFWGKRIHDLGAGPEPLRLSHATSDELAIRLRALIQDPRFAASARRTADAIATEDGPGAAVRVLENVAARGG